MTEPPRTLADLNPTIPCDRCYVPSLCQSDNECAVVAGSREREALERVKKWLSEPCETASDVIMPGLLVSDLALVVEMAGRTT